MSERITIQTIESMQFDIKPRGYDRDAVDTFLDAICDEMERMNNEAAALRQQLREAQAAASRAAAAQPAPAPVQPVQPVVQPAQSAGNAEILGILELANRLKNETLAEAQKKADEILEEANTQARENLGSLAAERDSLTNQVEALRKTVGDYRERFTALLQAQQDAMDKISDL
ncbi:MAG: DivIVA domain-containing protein [Clostridia bacterium]|nr:DivIVA domain-containing protein [Clostridia bacterium]